MVALEMESPCERINLIGAQLSLCDKQQLLKSIQQNILGNKRMLILSGNVHAFNLAYRQAWLRDFYNQADIVRLDGAGVRLGAGLLGYKTPARMTWADFTWELAEYAELHGFTLFFLGARPGVADKAAAKLKIRFPDLQVVGIHHGYFNKTPGSPETESLVEKINAVKPNILIVGFGMPLQERWLMENIDRIVANVVLTGGAVFDYVSGELRRGPSWLVNHGFEWLARLIVEPRRLWKRYVIGNPLFFIRIFIHHVLGIPLP